MKLRKFCSLSLALALQVVPLTRLFVVATPVTGSSFAIIAMWLGGAAAFMGSVDAVSGASSISVSPATATNGVPYSGIVQYSGSHASSAKSWQLKNNWNGAQSGCATSYQIAPGLWLTNASTYLVRVGGTPTASGTYSFTMKILDGSNCSGGNSDTRTASITIAAGSSSVAPSITTQPVSQTVTAGNNASFSVAASGTGQLTYQWTQNGANVGGNSATLSLTGVTSGQAGNYMVVVANSVGSVTSSVATLTVNVAPSITTQPVSQTVTAGNNASFSVVASGTAPLTYQWIQNGVNVGGNSATLPLTNVTAGQAGSYLVVVANSAGSVTSSVATLTVNSAPVAPSITTQPVNQTVTAGNNASFSVAASGTGPLTYQWTQNGANAGGNSATLSLTGVTSGQAGNYMVVVANSVGSVTSSVATLTVNVAPTITTQPVNQTVTVGGSANFSVVATGTGPLTYQWKQNGTNVGANTAALVLTGVTFGQAGNYAVVIANSVGSVTSSVATLTVNSATIAPSITTQPVNQSVNVGGTANFSVLASGTGPLTYQWKQNGANVGANSSTLSLTGVTSGQAGNYLVVVANSAGSVTSSVATLTVNIPPTPPSIITQPLNQTVYVGDTANFAVLATGTGPLNYQWRHDGTNVSGANSAALTLLNAAFDQAGSYVVVVTNSIGSVTSSVANLTVNPLPLNDTIRPTVAITAPAAGVVGSPAVTILGVAADNVGVKTVWYSLNGNDFGNATGSARWSVWGSPWPVVLAPGTNIVRAYSEDLAGNFSLTNSVVLVYNLTDALTLAVNGGGKVTGAANGQQIKAGSLVKLKALPTSGNIFSNWCGLMDGAPVCFGNAPTLTVPMSHQLAITANFVPNPFLAVPGQYNGLFYETNGVKVGTCGSFSLKVTALGAYTGTILNNGLRSSVSGRFDAGGKATNVVKRSGVTVFTAAWALDLGGSDQIGGTIGTADWSAELSGDRAVFNSKTNPCGYAGKYTFVLPGLPGSTLVPEGNGYGTVTINTSGLMVLKGSLADKSPMSLAVPVSKNGDWPMFLSFAARKGLFISWVNLTNRPTDDFNGPSIWLMPPQAKAKFYPSGFAYSQTLVGSSYTPPVGKAGLVLGITDGFALLNGGELTGSYTNEIVFGNGGQVTTLGSKQFSAVFAPATGLFQGTFAPGTGAKLVLGGVAFQKTTNAFGYISGQAKNGSLMLEAAPLP